jgi:hypothetical protein
MDQMETFEHRGWTFLCSAELLPSGLYHAVVRYRCPPSNEMRTLDILDGRYSSATEALLAGQARAVGWVDERDGDGRSSD